MIISTPANSDFRDNLDFLEMQTTKNIWIGPHISSYSHNKENKQMRTYHLPKVIQKKILVNLPFKDKILHYVQRM